MAKLLRSRILEVVINPEEITQEEINYREAQRIIKGLDHEEMEDYEIENYEYKYQDCAIDFDRKLIFISSDDGSISILPFTNEMILEESLDSIEKKYNNISTINKILTKIKLQVSKFFRMFAKEN